MGFDLGGGNSAPFLFFVVKEPPTNRQFPPCRVTPREDLPERRIAHAEACAHVFRDQLDGGAVGDWIRLGQILHGLDQQALPVNVSGIGSSFSAFAAKFWRNRNGEDLGHEENPTSQRARQV